MFKLGKEVPLGRPYLGSASSGATSVTSGQKACSNGECELRALL